VTHTVGYVVVALLLLYFGMVAMLWYFQEHIVFQPPAVASSGDVAARRVTYRADDGAELFAYVVGDCRANSPAVVAFHGNAELARWLVPWAVRLSREADACVMLAEYRGYDGLGGVPTYESSALDARAALACALDSLGASRNQLVYFGHSLGSAIATELAVTAPPRALVLQSPFSSARAMSRRMFVPGLSAFWRIISRVHFDTKERVRELDVPVFVSHGTRDLIVPTSMGRDVFTAARRKGELLIVDGAGHNDVAEVAGEAYWRWLRGAVRSAPETPVSHDARAETRSAP
jgi:pimeloyl-ACP methyl ester carboxylesterase